jgi:hypothetical protein
MMIEKFWHIVLSQHPEFAEYIRAQDFKYLELIKDIYVSWDVADNDDQSIDPGNFTMTFEFESSGDGDFPAQTVTKKFQLQALDPQELQRKAEKKQNDLIDSDEDMSEEKERLVSENAHITWPQSYNPINPSKITDKKSTEGKKNYRTGMKSFFGWFRWTGKKPGKEFPNGDDLARLFSSDLFPNAVMYYTEAQRDGLEEEIDSDASEPLDLSDNGDVEEEKLNAMKRKYEC